MKPQSYLNPLAKKYFRAIEKILKGRGMDDDAFSIELSTLATELAKYQEANEMAAKHGFYNQYENKTFQVNAFHTMTKDAFNAMKYLSPKFGLNPADFEKIKSAVKEDEPQDPIMNI